MAELTVPKLDFSALGDLPKVYQEAQQASRERRIQDVRQQTLANLGQGTWDFETGAKQLIAAGDLQGAMSLATIGKSLRPDASANSVFGTPIYGTRSDGSTAIGTFDKRGQFKEIQTPGFTPTPGVKMLDTGTGFVPVQSRTGQPVSGGNFQPGASAPSTPGAPPPPVGFIPKDVAGEARDKKLGTEEGEKLAGLGAAKQRIEAVTDQMDRLSFTARSVRDDPALGRITGVMGVFPNMPGGAAANVQARLETLKSQVGLAVLQGLRDASKTGGAVGQVSNFEQQIFQQNIASVDQLQSQGKFKEAMDLLINYAEGAKKRMADAYNQDYGNLKGRGNQSGPPAGGASSVPQGAANALRQNPALRDQFDAKYGRGEAAKVLGR